MTRSTVNEVNGEAGLQEMSQDIMAVDHGGDN